MPAETPPLRVLVIDDSVDNAEALGAFLDTLGCRTTLAFDGPHGIDAVAGFDPQLVFIDLEMPGMDGCEVARRLRSTAPESATKLVCLTGRGQPGDRRLCLDAGFDDFYTKPMPPDSLVRVVAASQAAR